METEVTHIKLYLDKDAWCALIGEDIQSGLCGFGKTKAEAINALAFALNLNKPPLTIDPLAFRKD